MQIIVHSEIGACLGGGGGSVFPIELLHVWCWATQTCLLPQPPGRKSAIAFAIAED